MTFKNLYIPERLEIMPTKRAYLFRAGFKGEAIILDDKMRNLANSIYTNALELSDAKLYYTTKLIKEVPNQVIPDLFKGVQLIAFFVSTLGKRIDEEIGKYIAQDKVLHATLLDAWASEALEALNHSFDARLRLKYGKGTRRFSPGYEDVDICKNSIILDFLQVDIVRANKETGILLPRKSTVCMIGF